MHVDVYMYIIINIKLAEQTFIYTTPSLNGCSKHTMIELSAVDVGHARIDMIESHCFDNNVIVI